MDTEAFDKFRESFTAFEEQVKTARTGTKEISKSFVGVSASTERIWASVSKHTQTIAGNIASATRSLLRWAEIDGIIAGLLGIGSLWGLDRFAIAAGNMRRNALGQNITPGEQRGFAATFGRLFDPGHFLGAVNAAMHDVTQRVGLYGAGLTEKDIRGKDTGQVAELLVTAIGKIADATPDNMMAQVLKATHLDQFMTLEDFERVKATPPAERAEYLQQDQARRRELELTKEQQKTWQNLQVQLHFAGMAIETSLIRALTRLAPQIDRLSKAFVGVFEAFLKNKEVVHWIDAVSQALETFANYVGKPEFVKKIDAFVTHVGKTAESFASMLPDLEAFGRVIAGFVHVIGALVGPPVIGKPLSHDEALRWNKEHPDQPTPVPPEPSLPPFSWWNPGSWLYHSDSRPPGTGRPMSQSEAREEAIRQWNKAHPDQPIPVPPDPGFQRQSFTPDASNRWKLQLPGEGRPMFQSEAREEAIRQWNKAHPDQPIPVPPDPGLQRQSYLQQTSRYRRWVGNPNAGNRQLPGAGRPGPPMSFPTGGTFRSWGDLLYAVEGAESSHGHDPTMWRPNSAGALGWMQITPDAWHDFATGGQTNPLDRKQSWEVAQNELSHYMKMYGFDLQKMLAAYNWGPRHVNEAMAYARKYGRSWLDDPRMPKETRDYLKKILGAGGDTDHGGRSQPSGGRPHPEDSYQQKFRNSRTRIEICNNTGGNATVTAAQLAA